MAFPQSVKDDAHTRAGGRCECTRKCNHHTGRCSASLIYGKWEAHHVVAGGPDTLSNCEALCGTCHKNTGTYGSG
jgi:hypothetical protein